MEHRDQKQFTLHFCCLHQLQIIKNKQQIWIPKQCNSKPKRSKMENKEIYEQKHKRSKLQPIIMMEQQSDQNQFTPQSEKIYSQNEDVFDIKQLLANLTIRAIQNEKAIKNNGLSSIIESGLDTNYMHNKHTNQKNSMFNNMNSTSEYIDNHNQKSTNLMNDNMKVNDLYQFLQTPPKSSYLLKQQFGHKMRSNYKQANMSKYNFQPTEKYHNLVYSPQHSALSNSYSCANFNTSFSHQQQSNNQSITPKAVRANSKKKHHLTGQRQFYDPQNLVKVQANKNNNKKKNNIDNTFQTVNNNRINMDNGYNDYLTMLSQSGVNNSFYVKIQNRDQV